MNRSPSNSQPVAVFDFDKTLINTDVAYHFFNSAIKRSKIRRIAFGMLMPVLLPFLLIRKCRIIAVSVMLWIATFPLHGKTARDVFCAFAPSIWQPPINGRFYDDGLTVLMAHRKLGHRLLIISGSPQDLVDQVSRTILPEGIDVIGSRIVPFLGGLVYRRYCMRSTKIILARERGLLNDNWDYGYSDSTHDIPLLARCRHRFLVNPDKKTIRQVKAALGDHVSILNWTHTYPKDIKH